MQTGDQCSVTYKKSQNNTLPSVITYNNERDDMDLDNQQVKHPRDTEKSRYNRTHRKMSSEQSIYLLFMGEWDSGKLFSFTYYLCCRRIHKIKLFFFNFGERSLTYIGL